jgi:hypothetical protein
MASLQEQLIPLRKEVARGHQNSPRKSPPDVLRDLLVDDGDVENVI